MIETRKIILPCTCRTEPKTLFVFGDNILGRGKGGQAIIRDEPNAIGIPTKFAPTERPGAYFNNQCLCDLEVARRIDEAFDALETHIHKGGKVVWPIDGVGTGRAKLGEKAPIVMKYINERYAHLISLCKTKKLTP